MASQRLYYDDSYTTRFQARIIDARPHDRYAVELEATYFFPEGGGQEADRGRIGEAAVIDVQADPEGRVWHVLEGDQVHVGGELPAVVDWSRRFDHMQQHTGQHVLSAALERDLGAATLSSHLGESRSTIEIDRIDIDWKAIERLEGVANQIVWQDRPVHRHWVDDQGVKRFALRKPPKFTGRIRIIEIPEWDVSACGGTHTERTGEVGIIKVVRWEKMRGHLRLEFLCGGRALTDYAWRTESLLEAARRRTLKDRELIAHLERAAEERDELAKRLQELSTRLVASEAAERVGSTPRPVADFASARSREELRLFAIKCLEAGAPWVSVGAAGPEPVLIAARTKIGSADLRALLPELLERARGKGGGGPDFLQVAAADPGSAEAAWRWMTEAMAAAVGPSA